MKWLQPTLRLRMAFLYGGLVLVVGAAMLCTAAILLDRAISSIQLLSGDEAVYTDNPQYPDHSANKLLQIDPKQLRKDAQQEARQSLLSAGIVYFGIVVVIGGAGGYFLARQSLRPISRVTQIAQRLSTENLNQSIDLGGPHDELRELADTFDDMLGRLAAAFDSQQRFVANASHELRTPLAVMRTEVDVTLSDPDAPPEELRRMGQVIEEQTARAERTVESLLELARLQAQQGSGLEVREAVDLAALTPAAMQLSSREARTAGIVVTPNIRPAWVIGDPRLLERLMGNLLENAVRHNVPGGWVRVSCGQAGQRVYLEVANGGASVPPEDVHTLLEPFRRGARARTGPRGSGLGLSIVRGLVEAHGGKLDISAPPTGGLRIVVDLAALAAFDATPAPRGR
jgi:signal transduction histidine kinase